MAFLITADDTDALRRRRLFNNGDKFFFFLPSGTLEQTMTGFSLSTPETRTTSESSFLAVLPLDENGSALGFLLLRGVFSREIPPRLRWN